MYLAFPKLTQNFRVRPLWSQKFDLRVRIFPCPTRTTADVRMGFGRPSRLPGVVGELPDLATTDCSYRDDVVLACDFPHVHCSIHVRKQVFFQRLCPDCVCEYLHVLSNVRICGFYSVTLHRGLSSIYPQRHVCVSDRDLPSINTVEYSQNAGPIKPPCLSPSSHFHHIFPRIILTKRPDSSAILYKRLPNVESEMSHRANSTLFSLEMCAVTAVAVKENFFRFIGLYFL